MRSHKIQAVRGYKSPKSVKGRPSILAPNRVNRALTVDAPDRVWVTDITYIRTWRGWLYLAVVLDLHSRAVVGWSMKPTSVKELVLDSLMMAVWRRKPKQEVTVLSDQGSQHSSDDWKRFCDANQLLPSMSRRGNCWDNAVAESFFSALKKKSASESVSTKPRIWLAPMCLITSRLFTIEPDVAAIWVASVPRRLNAPQFEVRVCLPLRGKSISS